MKTMLILASLLASLTSFADSTERKAESNMEPKALDNITIKGDPSMPEGMMGYVQFHTVEGHVLHIGPGGICLYEQGRWQRWCK